MKTMMMAVVLACAGSTAPASVANSNATVQPAGPRTGANGLNFMNIEGSGNGTFADFAVARFDLTADKAALDTLYGAGNWTVGGATLSLVESNAAFSHVGGMNVYFSSDDSTSLLAGVSPLRYDATVLPGGNNQGATGLAREATPVTSYVFPTNGNVNSGQVDSYSLTLTPGLLSRLISGSADSVVTLVFEGQDATVAATYAGFSNATLAGPTLTINAVQTPAPGALALAAVAGVVGVRRRR